MKNNCIIVGAGTYGQVYAEYLKEKYNVVGYIDDNIQLHHQVILGNKVLGDFNFLLSQLDKSFHVFIPIGNNTVRKELFRRVRESGFCTPNYIHPTVNIDKSAIISDQGVYILQGSIIMPLVKIENNVMISSGSIVSHHTHIKSNVFISFGVNIGASLIIREGAFIGIGSVIMTGVEVVGIDSVIGAGAVILKNVPDEVVMIGNPGRILRNNKTH